MYDFNNRPREFDVDGHMRESKIEWAGLKVVAEESVNVNAKYLNELMMRAHQYESNTGDNLFTGEQGSFLSLGKK